MTAIRMPGLESFLRKPDSAVAAVLIYGDEPGTVRDVAARAVKRLAGAVDDPFSVVNLQDGDLSGDPGRLVDEVQSQSMFGGARVIWLREAGEAFHRAAGPLLDGKVAGNVVVAESGLLQKSSALRQAFEKSKHALILPIYEADAGEAAGMAESILAADSIRIGRDGLHRFIELVGTSRSLVQREAEKLALYCLGRPEASVADVEAICGNDMGAEPDDLVDSAMGGDVAVTDRLFQALVASGADAGRLLSAAHGHVMRLQDLKAAAERGAQLDQLVRSARPVIFFKRQPRVQSQLKLWPMAELVRSASTIGTAVQQVRQTAPLAPALANRCFLSLARKALALRQEQI